MRVNETREISTVQPGTLGETPSCVSMRPKTIHGWRPISVKTQPTRIAKSDAGHDQIASFHAHWGTSRLAFLCVSHRPTTAVRAAMPPRPIIQRNDQYVTQRTGAKLPPTW